MKNASGLRCAYTSASICIKRLKIYSAKDIKLIDIEEKSNSALSN